MKKPPEPGVPAPDYDALLRAAPLPRLEARVLMAFASGRPSEWLVAHGDESVEGAVASRFGALAHRRAAGEPMAYLTGSREFYGRRFRITPAVLIPRPETEHLVEAGVAALAALADAALPNAALPDAAARGWARVLDLGTGSGIVAITLALEYPDATVVATDRSAEALAVARTNAAALGAGRIEFRSGDWWAALDPAMAPFHLIVSNPPYVASADPHLSQGDLRHEPLTALAAGADGLDALRTLISGAATWLAPGGTLAVEHGYDQGDDVRRLMAAAGWRGIRSIRDLEHHERVTVGSDPAGNAPCRR